MGRRAPLLVMLSFALSPLCAVVAISVTAHTSSSLCANRHLGLGAYSNTFGGRPRGNTAVALATERREEPPHVMFICKANSCRSQMAHGFMDQLSAGKIVSQSSGCISASVVNKKAVQVMDEIGIDLSAYGSNGLDEYDPFAKPYDAVVCLCGCKDLVPESWQSTAGGSDSSIGMLTTPLSSIREISPCIGGCATSSRIASPTSSMTSQLATGTVCIELHNSQPPHSTARER